MGGMAPMSNDATGSVIHRPPILFTWKVASRQSLRPVLPAAVFDSNDLANSTIGLRSNASENAHALYGR